MSESIRGSVRERELCGGEGNGRDGEVEEFLKGFENLLKVSSEDPLLGNNEDGENEEEKERKRGKKSEGKREMRCLVVHRGVRPAQSSMENLVEEERKKEVGGKREKEKRKERHVTEPIGKKKREKNNEKG